MNTTLGEYVNCNKWYNLTISHYNDIINITLNEIQKTLFIDGPLNYLYIDPEIYIGGGPELHKKKVTSLTLHICFLRINSYLNIDFIGLKSNNYFVGSLKYVFFNEISILYELQKKNPKVHYIGLLEPEFRDADIDSIPITFPFHFSHIRWHINNANQLSLKFDFKSNKNLAILAAAEVITETGIGYWEVCIEKK